MRWLGLVVTLLAAPVMAAGGAREAPWLGKDSNGLACARFPGGRMNVGPFDYTNPAELEALPTIEQYHFTPEVERLERGRSTATLFGDLHFTVVAYPNHHRALHAIVRYDLRGRPEPKRGEYPPAECYLNRAMAFAPRDPKVRLLYAIYLHRRGALEPAKQQYEKGLALAPDYAELHYNYGLLLVEMDQTEAAVEHAKEAYRLGYPLPGLRKKLVSRGAWSADSD